jgi:hypothetical protein
MTKQSRSGGDLDAPQLIELLVAEMAEIESIKLFRPRFFPLVQESVGIGDPEQRVIRAGLKLRDDLGLSFWDSLLLHLSTHAERIDNLLKLATRHNRQDLDCTPVRRADCKEDKLRGLIAQLIRGQILAISSEVQTIDGLFRHLPMLDFHCRESDANLNAVKTIIHELGLTGFVVSSGGSYHFYGRSLVDEQGLITLLSRSLLFSPIVDHRWVAHQLLERACGLRISPGKEYQSCPKVIAEI